MTAPFSTMIHGPDGEPMPISLKVSTGCSAIVSAAHRSRDGQMHGHAWEVRAWWPEGPDATEKQAELRSYLSVFDHQVLGDEIAWAEALAKAVCLGMRCSKVEVSRPLEGLFAIAEVDPSHD